MGCARKLAKESLTQGWDGEQATRRLRRSLMWCGWRGSNPRPLASEANTLSTELQPQRSRILSGQSDAAARLGWLAIIERCLPDGRATLHPSQFLALSRYPPRTP